MSSKISIVGAGYVGFSLAVLLAQNNKIIVLDNDKNKISKINSKISPIKDKLIKEYLNKKKLNLHATTSSKDAFLEAEFIVIALPTNFNSDTGNFDLSSFKKVIKEINDLNKQATIIIKSTLPLGFTETLNEQYENNIFFSPEFLREGSALYDNLHPSRIIISSDSMEAKKFVDVLKNCASKNDIETFYMSSKEAESVKLFSNSYLAMRVAFFNELDNFSIENKLNTQNIINGISSDARIGDGYNNPSFGYGGYCLPKDTKQLLSNFENIPNDLISSIISSNKSRRLYLAKKIMDLNPKKVGIFGFAMKKDSDNFRESTSLKLTQILIKNNIDVYLYEPNINTSLPGIKLIDDINLFKEKCDLIITNRMTSKLDDISEKVFTRDIFNRD